MELAKIEKIIEKYLEGNTTLAEEQQLKVYFSSSNVAPHLEHYTPLFNYFSFAESETYTKEIAIKPKKSYKRRWLSIASVFVIGMSVYATFQFQQNNEEQEALLAFKETKKALQMLSLKFNKGAEKMAYLNEFEQTKNQVFKKEN